MLVAGVSPFRWLAHSDRLFITAPATAVVATAAAAASNRIFIYFSFFFAVLFFCALSAFTFPISHNLFKQQKTGGRGINKWFPCNKNAKEERSSSSSEKKK